MRAHLALMFAVLLIPGLRADDRAAPVGPPRLLDDIPGLVSTATAINNFGHVTGWHLDGHSDAHGFVWTEPTGFVDIDRPGGMWSRPYDINDLDQVIGSTTTPDNALRGFIWTPSTGMRDLGPWAVFAPRAINNFGVIAGSLNRQAALRMPDGTYLLLGTLGGPSSVALDINDRGEVVGASAVGSAPPLAQHPFYWSAETGMIDIHQPGTAGGAATRINNRGEVAGYLEPGLTLQSYVYTWTRDGGTVNIGSYPGGFIVGGDYGNVFGINGLGQVVATSTFPGDEITRQLLWSGGDGPCVIGEDLPAYSHMGINDVGEVAGSTHAPDGRTTAAVWRTVLTSEQRADSLRALVEGLALRSALRRQDARVLIRKASDDDRFATHVAALVRSDRLSARDAWLLTRAIHVHARADNR